LAMTVLGLALGWARSPSVEAVIRAKSDLTGSFFPNFGMSGVRLDQPVFDTSGIVLGAHTFLALIVGSTIALLLRNTIASMVVALALLVFVPATLANTIRPHYATPDVDRQAIAGSVWSGYSRLAGISRGSDWIVGQGYVDGTGAGADIDELACPWSAPFEELAQRHGETIAQYKARTDALDEQTGRRLAACLVDLGASAYEVRFHSNRQYWRFQATEAALLLTLAGLLMAPALWGVRRLRP
ncbi:hypothetical protein, partial [Rhodococcus sp. NPDC058514]